MDYHHPKPIKIIEGGNPVQAGMKGKNCKACKRGGCKKHGVYKANPLDAFMGIDKGVRRIRTAEGARKYGKPIGSLIGGGSKKATGTKQGESAERAGKEDVGGAKIRRGLKILLGEDSKITDRQYDQYQALGSKKKKDAYLDALGSGKSHADSIKAASGGSSSAPAKRTRSGDTVDTDLGGSAEAGMKLLSARHRKLHPRAQVQTLRRIAVRAQSDADWLMGIPSKQHPNPPKHDGQQYTKDRAKAQRKKAKDALAAMQQLNREHKLGYGR